MPIRPEYRWLYPIDWRELSIEIRFVRAGGRCEHCRRPHGRRVRHLGDGRWWDEAVGKWRDGRGCIVRHGSPALACDDPSLAVTTVVLATAHLDHDPGNNEGRNLRALCQRCYLIHDRDEHLRQRLLTYRALRAWGPVPGSLSTMKMVAGLLLISGAVFTTASLASSNVKVETFAAGLVHPWSIAFLPGGHSLVSERPGRMRVVSPQGVLSQPVAGLPDVFASQTLGLLDVVVAHDFPTSRTIFFCYSHLKQQDGFTFSVLTVATAQLEGFEGPSPALQSQKTLFEQTPVIADDYGVLGGCRIVLQGDYLFAALGAGDRMSMLPELLDNTFGKVVRIRTDGSIPSDNPFVGTPSAKPEIWSLGHRNPEGLTFDAEGQLWEQEHGPQGGDKINRIERGADYGWPVLGYGVNYGGADIHAKNHRDGVTEPSFVWVPSIAPSGMTFYSGKLWPEWKGSLFNGALKARRLVRLDPPINRGEQPGTLLSEVGERIRDVREGPDGALYVLTDNENGRILRLTPADE